MEAKHLDFIIIELHLQYWLTQLICGSASPAFLLSQWMKLIAPFQLLLFKSQFWGSERIENNFEHSRNLWNQWCRFPCFAEALNTEFVKALNTERYHYFIIIELVLKYLHSVKLEEPPLQSYLTWYHLK